MEKCATIVKNKFLLGITYYFRLWEENSMKLKRVVSLVLVGAMAMSTLVSCGEKATSGGDTTGGSNSDTFLIGGMGPLTGSNASYGTSVKQGAEIAIKEINDAGGVKIGDKSVKLALKFEDDEADEQKAVNAYNNLADAKVNAIMGAVTSGACIAIVDKSFKDNILQITPSGSAMDCTKNPNNFRLCFTDPLQGQTMAKYAVETLGYKKIAVIFNNADEYSTGMKEAFVAKVKELGAEIVQEESFATDDVDFNTQLTKISDSGADCIFVPTYYKDAALITKQASEKGMKLPFLGGDGWDGILEKVSDPSIIEGAIFLSPFLSSNPEEACQKFVTAYKEAYKETPDQFAADGYDTVYVMKAAAEKAGSMDSDKLIAAMTQIQVNGLTGNMTFNADGEPNKEALFVEIKNGEYTAK